MLSNEFDSSMMANDAYVSTNDQKISNKAELLNSIVILYALLNEIQNDETGQYSGLKNRLEASKRRYDPKDTEKKRPGWAIAYGKK